MMIGMIFMLARSRGEVEAETEAEAQMETNRRQTHLAQSEVIRMASIRRQQLNPRPLRWRVLVLFVVSAELY